MKNLKSSLNNFRKMFFNHINFEYNMKKILIVLMAMFAITANTYAEDKIVISDVDLPEKGTANLVVNMISQEKQYYAFQFDIKLPKGITASVNTSGFTERCTSVSGTWTVAFKQTDAENNIWNCVAFNMENAYIAGTDGAVLNITLTADETLTDGMELEGTLMNVVMSTRPQKYEPEGGSFQINIVENRIELDENATTAPAAAENVNVKVLRSINANSWSTICLPFAMTEDQVVEAFGNGVKIAEFTGCTWGDDNNILLDFTSKTEKSIDANHPYIIMVSEAITHDVGFNVDNITIAPERDPAVEVERGDAAFIGTYEALEGIGSNRTPVLFIAQNKFWYSKGTANLKAYRGYFEIDDLKNYIADAKIGFFVNDEATLIDGMGIQFAPEGVYDLSGRKIQLENGDMNKLQKGVYIINGKKVTIK